jgi:hypothetical protein
MPPHQTGKASIECGLDENLEKGASYYQTGKYLRLPARDFGRFCSKATLKRRKCTKGNQAILKRPEDNQKPSFSRETAL